jgi:hypothetical protein
MSAEHIAFNKQVVRLIEVVERGTGMNVSAKATVISSIVSLLIGLLVGFIPCHLKNSSLMEQNRKIQSELSTTRGQLTLSRLAVRSAAVYSEAEKDNFSVASGSASSFFTDLREYINQSAGDPLKQQLEEIMGARDPIIAGLAKADPAVLPQLRQLFLRMQRIQASTPETPSKQ